MKALQPTTKYKKDLKRYANNPKKIAALTEVTSCSSGLTQTQTSLNW